MNTRISKSRFLLGRHCHKRLWLRASGVEEPESEASEVLEMREAEGARVEQIAERLFPDALRIAPAIDDDDSRELHGDLAAFARSTVAALRGSQSIIQAHLEAGDLLAIADVLELRPSGWFVWEVKSSTHTSTTKVKKLYDWDLAFQVHVAEQLGLRIAGAGLLLIDRNFELEKLGEIDAEAFITRVDRTEIVRPLVSQVRQEVGLMRAVVADDAHEPEIDPTPRCKGSRGVVGGDRPSTCGHLSRSGDCGRLLPKYWAGTLPKLQKRHALYVESHPYLRIEDLDEHDEMLNWHNQQGRVIRAVQAGAPEIDAAALRVELDRIEWPVSYLDFEFDPGMAIPRFVGTRPYDRIPFQWALLIQDEPGAALRDPGAFLHLESTDPRELFARSLLAALPATGSIIAHHASAETTVLKQLAAQLGGPLKDDLLALCTRFEDTEKMARSGYYHPDQQGSYSIKKLAPALVGHGYDGLDIADGMAAVTEWQRALAPETTAEERESIRANLLQYCGRDAELMHAVVEGLRELA